MLVVTALMILVALNFILSMVPCPGIAARTH